MNVGFVRRLARRFGGPRGLILLYHRVAERALDPWQLAVSPAHFAEHMEILRRSSRVAPLAQVNESRAKGTIRNDVIAVTFDDGYADNLLAALPILTRNEVPATVFVATRAVEDAREFWWDELERLLLHQRPLPSSLQLQVGDTRLVWQLDASAAGTTDYPDWRAESPPPTIRHRIYLDLCVRLRAVSPAERADVLSRLRDWSGAEQATRQPHRPLTPNEVAQLSSSGLVEIGAHTVHHPALGQRPVAEQEREIRESRSWLQQVTGRSVDQFSYPFGGSRMYTADTVATVRAAGFLSAGTTRPGTVNASTDPFRLPRVYVYDVDGEGFLRLLRDYIDPSGS